MDEIIKIIGAKASHITFKYSTPSQYLKEVKSEIEQKNIELQVYSGDFFPVYEIWKDVHWNGYYTSRPNFKKLIRDLASIAYQSSTLYGFNWFKKDISDSEMNSFYQSSYALLEAVGLAMHHDTITGTS